MRGVVVELGLSAELRGIDLALEVTRDKRLDRIATLTPVITSLLNRKGHAAPRKATETWATSFDAREAPQTAGEDRRMIHGIRQAWSSKYAPSSLEALRRYISHGQGLSSDTIYGRTIVFIQSSGMGKSRLAAEFAQSCPAINYVLREESTFVAVESRHTYPEPQLTFVRVERLPARRCRDTCVFAFSADGQ